MGDWLEKIVQTEVRRRGQRRGAVGIDVEIGAQRSEECCCCALAMASRNSRVGLN